MSFHHVYFGPRVELENGLTLVQIDTSGKPLYAVQLHAEKRDTGWLYSKHPDGQWVTKQKLDGLGMEVCYEMQRDMVVRQDNPKVRTA